MNQSINDKAVYRTAPATPVLLTKIVNNSKHKLWQNSNIQIGTETQQPELWQNYKKKNDRTQKLILWGKNSKKQVASKLKTSNCDKTTILNLWQNFKKKVLKNQKTQIVIKAQKLELWQNLKNQVVTKLTSSNCGNTKKWQY